MLDHLGIAPNPAAYIPFLAHELEERPSTDLLVIARPIDPGQPCTYASTVRSMRLSSVVDPTRDESGAGDPMAHRTAVVELFTDNGASGVSSCLGYIAGDLEMRWKELTHSIEDGRFKLHVVAASSCKPPVDGKNYRPIRPVLVPVDRPYYEGIPMIE